MSNRPYDYRVDGLQNHPYDQEQVQDAVSKPLPDRPTDHWQADSSPKTEYIPILAGAVAIAAISGVALLNPSPKHDYEKPCQAVATKHDLAAVRTLFASKSNQLPELAADRYGVTIVDNYHTIRQLRRSNSALPHTFDTLLNTANESLGAYAIRISVIDQDEAEDIQAHTPTAKELQDTHVSSNVADIVEGISGLPVEYTQLSGVKRVVLYTRGNPEASSGQGKAFVYGADDGTIYYDLGPGGDPTTIAHEVYHKIDWRECTYPRMSNDPAFTDLNPGNIYQGKPQGAAALYDEPKRSEQTLNSLFLEAQLGRPKEEYCRTREAAARFLRTTVSATKYGLTSPEDDKAEIGGDFTYPERAGLYLNPLRPVLKQKYELLMARLYHLKPNIVKYFAAVSSRPPEVPYDC